MACCKNHKRFVDDWCERHDIVFTDGEGDEYCVFHAPEGEKNVSPEELKVSPEKSKVSREEFNKKVLEEIYRAKEEKRACDLSGAVFEWDIGFSEFGEDNPLPEIKFEWAQFSETADFSGAKFSEKADFTFAEFKKTNFSGAKFSEKADFTFTEFSKWAIFSSAKFKETNFSGAKFSGEAVFLSAKFSGEAYFAGAEFSGEANFSFAEFKEANFHEAAFKEADFHKANFSEKAYFYKAIFSKEADFHRATFSGEADFFRTAFNEKAGFSNLTTSESRKFEKVNLEKVSFMDTDLRKIDFVNCTWPVKKGRNILHNENAVMEEYKQGYLGLLFDELKQTFKNKDAKLWTLLKQTEKRHKAFKDEIRKVEILYRRLKQKYKDEHDWPEVSNWHYGEKEMYRKGSLFRRYFPLSLSNLYWLSSGYAERPVRAGLVLLALILGISGLMELTAFVPAKEAPIWITDLKGFWKMIGYGFSTLQYITFHKEPVFVPSSLLGGGLTLFARIVVPIQVAFVVMALRNRFRR